MSIPLQNSVVYGPIHSRRLGVSLGINILPTERKYCFSNCVYCQYGFTDFKGMSRNQLKSADFLLEKVEQGFSEYENCGLRPNSITFSGNGESSTHPEFDFLVKGIKKLRDVYFPQTRLSILSDSSQVHLKHVQKTLKQFDDCYMKLDAGDDRLMGVINNTRFRTSWNKKLGGLKQIPNVSIQSMFISSPVDNSSKEQVSDWLGKIEQIRPKELHLYTIDRSPADEKAKAVSKKRLYDIAKLVNKKLVQVDIKVFK